jgi:hypothetical protein
LAWQTVVTAETLAVVASFVVVGPSFAGEASSAGLVVESFGLSREDNSARLAGLAGLVVASCLKLLEMVAVAWAAATEQIVPEVIDRTEAVEVETVVAGSDPEGTRLVLEAVRMGSSLELG